MHCIKCGKETKGEQVFCTHCLELMEKYPVKSDTPIQLPNRPNSSSQKKQNRKKRPMDQDEKIARLRRKNRWLGLLVLVLLLAVLLLVGKIYRDARMTDDKEIGKNYTYTEPTK